MNNESNYQYKGQYGSENTECTVFVYRGWYCVQGALTVNFAPRIMTTENAPWTHVCDYEDTECVTSSEPIRSLEQLRRFVRFLERHSD